MDLRMRRASTPANKSLPIPQAAAESALEKLFEASLATQTQMLLRIAIIGSEGTRLHSGNG